MSAAAGKVWFRKNDSGSCWPKNTTSGFTKPPHSDFSHRGTRFSSIAFSISSLGYDAWHSIQLWVAKLP